MVDFWLISTRRWLRFRILWIWILSFIFSK